MNGVAETMTGWLQTEAFGRPLPRSCVILDESTREPIENPALRALRERTVVAVANHTALVARDGTLRSIEKRAAPMYDEKGAVLGAVLIIRDLAERARAGEVSAVLAAIDESSEDAIIGKTLEGIVRSWKCRRRATFGYTAEAVGQCIPMIIPPEPHNEEAQILRASAAASGSSISRRSAWPKMAVASISP